MWGQGCILWSHCGVPGCLGPYDSLFNVLCCFLCPEYMWLLNKETRAPGTRGWEGLSPQQCPVQGHGAPTVTDGGCAAALEPSPPPR